MAPAEFFVEHFLQEMKEGHPQPPIRYDEERSLNVMPDGRPLVDIELEGGTVTGTRAGGEQDDADRDPEPTTVTMVQSEGYDYAAQAVQAGTITLTEANAEATDADEDEDISSLHRPNAAQYNEPMLGLFGTVTHTANHAEENGDVD